jgi:signal transduction histidine kinase
MVFILVFAIISFIYLFQRKLIKRKIDYQQIESLLKKEELKSAYATLEGQESERKRIAEDLHDNMGSMLASLRLYSDLLQEKANDPEMQRLAGKVAELTEQTASETRRISHELNLSSLKLIGLKVPIEQLCQAIQEARKIEVEQSVTVQANLPGELSINIYRIVQELLTNTLKHARATHVRLELTQVANDYLSLIFEDNGQGFDPALVKAGMGLQNLRARVDRFRGTISIDSSPVRGTTTIIEIPL